MQGQCLCGEVSFEIEETSEVAVCHCGMCRKWSGGPHMSLESKRVQISGEHHIQRYASSEWGSRSFCKQCGTNLFYQLNADPQTFYLNSQLFDFPAQAQIVSEIYVDHKPTFYPFLSETAENLTQADIEKMFSGSF